MANRLGGVSDLIQPESRAIYSTAHGYSRALCHRKRDSPQDYLSWALRQAAESKRFSLLGVHQVDDRGLKAPSFGSTGQLLAEMEKGKAADGFLEDAILDAA